MKRNIFISLIIAAMLCTALISCSKTEISENEMKQFVIEYDDALSKGWSESDEIFVPWVTKKYLWEHAFLDHCSNKKWFVYKDDIEILGVEKVPRSEYEFYSSNSYKIMYQRKAIAKIEDGKIIKLPESNEYGYSVVHVAPIYGQLMVTSYGYMCCWVKEKDLPALMKRKGLTWAE